MKTVFLKKFKKKNIFLFLVAVLGALICCKQLVGYSNDYFNYEKLFNNEYQITTEPLWNILSYININFLHNFEIIIFCTTFISLFIKINLFSTSEKCKCLLLIVYYFLTFFWLHEYTQFRATVAISIFTLSYYYEKDLRKTIFIYIICLFIHFSCIILFPFLIYSRMNSKRIYVVLPFIFFILAVLFSNFLRQGQWIYEILSVFKLDFFSVIIKGKLGHFDNSFTVFNKLYLMFYLILLITYFLGIKGKCCIDSIYFYSYKIISYSLSVFFIFSCTPFPVMALRFSEFFLPFGLILLVENSKFIKEKFFYFSFSLIIIIIMSVKLLQKTGRI